MLIFRKFINKIREIKNIKSLFFIFKINNFELKKFFFKMKNLKKGNCLISWSSTSNTDYFGYDLWEKGSVSHTVNGSIGKDAHYLKINVCAAISRKGSTKIEIKKKYECYRISANSEKHSCHLWKNFTHMDIDLLWITVKAILHSQLGFLC